MPGHDDDLVCPADLGPEECPHRGRLAALGTSNSMVVTWLPSAVATGITQERIAAEEVRISSARALLVCLESGLWVDGGWQLVVRTCCAFSSAGG